MDAIIVKVSLSYSSPIDSERLNELQDKFYNLIENEVNDGELAIDAECTDFEIETERSEE
jgi:hypothetical protein